MSIKTSPLKVKLKAVVDMVLQTANGIKIVLDVIEWKPSPPLVARASLNIVGEKLPTGKNLYYIEGDLVHDVSSNSEPYLQLESLPYGEGQKAKR